MLAFEKACLTVVCNRYRLLFKQARIQFVFILGQGRRRKNLIFEKGLTLFSKSTQVESTTKFIVSRFNF